MRAITRVAVSSETFSLPNAFTAEPATEVLAQHFCSWWSGFIGAQWRRRRLQRREAESDAGAGPHPAGPDHFAAAPGSGMISVAGHYKPIRSG